MWAVTPAKKAWDIYTTQSALEHVCNRTASFLESVTHANMVT